jgi:hypothetical protein
VSWINRVYAVWLSTGSRADATGQGGRLAEFNLRRRGGHALLQRFGCLRVG